MPLIIALLTAVIVLAALFVAWPWLRMPRTEAGDPDLTALALMLLGVAIAAGGPVTVWACGVAA
ncbi:hypothetical protein [Methylobacterium soli]|uniref:Uncharacterized protein n=1 Tax=Methylobacterium soli TaxID=553447 RepID=A0A6L3SWY6_9HYPH|nr:hypothetical protein [Methylobacterium soli]KAB1076675.1 hypothetical protein F6X53_22550 [Methylobacterium soli]